MTRSERTVLALDAHGGDQGLDVSVPAALQAVAEDERLRILLVGQRAPLEDALAAHGASGADRIEVHPAETILPMDVKSSAVLRRGRDSSLWQAFERVADGTADACVSGGSTAAMMVTGVRVLGMLEGIQRPALMAWVPSESGFTALLDLGANLQVSARHLVQFAVMGSVTAELAEGIARPRVGLLNVGHEDGKGHELVREAHAMLLELPLNYIGFVEGHDIFGGAVDVAVCDGFVGNLILKSTEGVARLMLQRIRTALAETPMARSGAALAAPSLRRALARLDPSAHNGAPLLGLRRIAVKSHGGADLAGMTRAILEAGREARRQVPRKIETSIHNYKLEMSA
ncbi:MAG: phosphate acyltransferase PlsX [Xanthomonadales bacterium]